MDPCVDLDYVLQSTEYVSKLGIALDTSNIVIKKQVFELLSTLCAYNIQGYNRAIEILEYYKDYKNERYRFQIVTKELEKATAVEYQAAIISFINCVIISAASLKDRLKIRNELIGLKVLPVLKQIRNLAHNVTDVVLQLDVFDEQKECDEALALQGAAGVNLNSHIDVFYSILRQVADTPQEIPFLRILQHLLKIDSKEPISDIIWDTAEKLVHRATLAESHEDTIRLLRTPSVQKFTCSNCRNEATSPIRKQSTVITISSSLQSQKLPNFPINSTPLYQLPATAPTIPNHSSVSIAPPPPPLPMILNNKQNINETKTTGTQMTLSSLNQNILLPPHPNDSSTVKSTLQLLPQQNIPVPKNKMKTFNWNKIPPQKVIGQKNIWAIVADSHQNDSITHLNWSEIEDLFCLQTSNTHASSKFRTDNAYDTVDRKTKKDGLEILLLDGKRSLNVNIFLKQFRSSNEDIILFIKEGKHYDIGAEKLRGLLKILPEVDEIDMLKTFDGDQSRLGNAEKFLLELIEVPNYKLRIECMLLKEELMSNISCLEPYINAMIFSAEDLMTNKLLHEILYMIVMTGNFLNAGGYAGNAAGMKLSSLQKLTDIRANKPGINLIHFVALQAEKCNPELLKFPTHLSDLENASKMTAEQINSEIRTLYSRIEKVKIQVELPTTEDDIKCQMVEFLRVAKKEADNLQNKIKEVETYRIKLAEFFCEDSRSFKIEECFKIFQNFCEKFKQAVKENERRRIQEEQAKLRKKQREEQMARRIKQISQNGSSVSDVENALFFDSSPFDVKNSPVMFKRRTEANNNIFLAAEKEDMVSPDITPNGTLRRRRSRICFDENDNGLMDFLKCTGIENIKERKTLSYGSLDRSWARRVKTGNSNMKRPDLFNIDFGVERERSNSPSPLLAAENRTKFATSKEWREKTDCLLETKGDYTKDNVKSRENLVNARRLTENETDHDKSRLDSLPEEKSLLLNNGIEIHRHHCMDCKKSTTVENAVAVNSAELSEDNHAKDIMFPKKRRLSDKSIEHPRRVDITGNNPGNLNTFLSERGKKNFESSCENPEVEKLKISTRTSDTSVKEKQDEIELLLQQKQPQYVANQKSQDVIPISHNKCGNSVQGDTKMTSTLGNTTESLPTSSVGTSEIQHAKNSKNQSLLVNRVDQFYKLTAANQARRNKQSVTREISTKHEEVKSPSNMMDKNSIAQLEKSDPDKSVGIMLNKGNKKNRLKKLQEHLEGLNLNKNEHKPYFITNNGNSKLESVKRHLTPINTVEVPKAIKNLKPSKILQEIVSKSFHDLPKEETFITEILNSELNDEVEETHTDISAKMIQSQQKTNKVIPTITRKKKELQNTRIQNFLGHNKRNAEHKPIKPPLVLNNTQNILCQPKSLVRKDSGTITRTLTKGGKSIERAKSIAGMRSSELCYSSLIPRNAVQKQPLSSRALSSEKCLQSKRPLATHNSTIKLTQKWSKENFNFDSGIRKFPLSFTGASLKENHETIKRTAARNSFRNTSSNATNTYSLNGSRAKIQTFEESQNTALLKRHGGNSNLFKPTKSCIAKKQINNEESK